MTDPLAKEKAYLTAHQAELKAVHLSKFLLIKVRRRTAPSKLTSKALSPEPGSSAQDRFWFGRLLTRKMRKL